MDAQELHSVATGVAELDVRTIHVRVMGRSHDLPLRTLNISESSSDDQIRTAVSENLDIQETAFKNTVVERHANGNLTLRPEAVFGYTV